MTASDSVAEDHTAPQTPAGVKERPIHRVTRLAFLTAICGLILLSTRAFFDYGHLAAALWGGSFIERGMLGADEWRNFLNRSARLEMQRSYGEARALGVSDRQVSGLALAWSWTAQTGDRLPPEARVYLNVPNSVLYFFGTTMWFPRKVEVGPSGALVRNDETLQSAAESIDPDRFHELQERGYTHVVTTKDNRLVVVDLREAAGTPSP